MSTSSTKQPAEPRNARSVVQTDRALLRRTLRTVRPDVARCLVAGVLWQAVALTVPWVLERAVDDGIVAGDRDALWAWSGALLALGVVRWVGDAARHWWVERAGAHAAHHLRQQLVGRVLTMDDQAAARLGHGDLAARALGDTEKVWSWVSGIATFVTATFTLVAVVVLLVTLDPVLALVGVGVVPFVALFSAGQVGAHSRAAAAVAAGSGSYAGAMEETITGARAIKGLGAEPVVLARCREASHSLGAAALRLARVEATWVAAASAIPAAGIAAGLWLGGTRVLDGHLTVGAIVAFAGWMALLVDATETFTERLVDRGTARAAATRIAAVLDAVPPDHDIDQGRVADRTATGTDIAVDRVTLRRGARELLASVDLDVASGEWVALIGRTGSGKSTLLRAVAGFERPLSGRIRIGGLDAHDIHRERPGAVVHVPQGPAPVSGTLRELLLLAAPNTADVDLHVALEAAAATDIVEQLGGLDGVVGERGLSLSGGQRQRLAIAMALTAHPGVLVLDDPTAALDPGTEGHLLAALRRCRPDLTVVMATHRPAAAAGCDRILEIADGALLPIEAAEARAQLTQVVAGA
jgi:ATP-binding cassette, subfamily B, bacterial